MQEENKQGVTVESYHVAQNDFIQRVYAWMAGGLALTAVIAWIVAHSEQLIHLFLGNIIVFYGLLIAELLLVIFLSRMVNSMTSTQASVVFLAYAALNGLTFSVIFLVYQLSSIYSVFIITAEMFAVISLYGWYTKKDLTTVGNIAFMGLIGLVLASVVNLFLMNSRADLILAYIGVVIFVALTAYDTQKIKNFNTSAVVGTEIEKKAAVMGALTLYLDFINLFLKLLRIMGKRR